MPNIILFDSDARADLLPLTATKPMGELRLGTTTLREKWERRLRGSASYITQDYLQEKFPIQIEEENLIVNAGIYPTEVICRRIDALGMGEALLFEGELLAARLNEAQFEMLIEDEEVKELKGIDLESSITPSFIRKLWDLTRLNETAIADDFNLFCSGRRSQILPDSNRLIGPAELLFIEEGARVECCTFNTSTGPIYIDKNALIMEGSLFRGPVSIGRDAIVKMAAKIYGPTTIGPGCRAGGEITRSIMMANSNKAHDGYLGDSVLGEWCNLGADTNTSNMKNNYSEVRLWSYVSHKFERSGRQFVGLFMGDHAKCGINTMFNSGTVVGVFANVFGSGYVRNFVPDFSWGGHDNGYRTYKFEEACATAAAVFQRRDKVFTELDKAILYHIYDRTAAYRSWEK